ncbi:MAG: hypothetical protein ACYDC8_15525 [Gammaproteobacteria bacterium]
MTHSYELPAEFFVGLLREYYEARRLNFIGLIHSTRDFIFRIETRLLDDAPEREQWQKLRFLCAVSALATVVDAKGVTLIFEARLRRSPASPDGITPYPQTAFLHSDETKEQVRNYEAKQEVLMVASVPFPIKSGDAVYLNLPVIRDDQGHPVVDYPPKTAAHFSVELTSDYINFLAATLNGDAGGLYLTTVQEMTDHFRRIVSESEKAMTSPIIMH